MKNYVDSFTKLPMAQKVIYVVLGYFAIKFVSRYFKKMKDIAKAKADALAANQEAAALGTTKDRLEIVAGYAADIQSAIFGWHKMFGVLPWWEKRMDEDEDTVIEKINLCQSVGEVKYLSKVFHELHPAGAPASDKLTLRASVMKYLGSSDRAKIKSHYLAALQ